MITRSQRINAVAASLCRGDRLPSRYGTATGHGGYSTFGMASNQILSIIVLLWLGSLVTALGEDNKDELRQRVLAQAQSVSPSDYAFTRTVRSEPTAGGNTETTITVDKYDPTKSGDALWTLISVDGAAPSADALRKYRKESPQRRIPGYHRLANYFAGPVTTATDSDGRTLFRFASLPKDSVLVFNSDVSHNTTAEAAVGEANGVPFVEQVRLSIKPTRIKLIMKLEQYESTSRFQMGPNGKPVLVEQIADVTGSGLGQKGRLHQVITYSDYRAVNRPR